MFSLLCSAILLTCAHARSLPEASSQPTFYPACHPGFVYNEIAQRCIKEEFNYPMCIDGYVFYYDNIGKGCTKVQGYSPCQSGYVYDDFTRTCYTVVNDADEKDTLPKEEEQKVLKKKKCRYGFNETTQKCERCGKGYVYDEVRRTCVTCLRHPGYEYNLNKHKCVKVKGSVRKCKPDEHYDERNQCFSCPILTTYNEVSRECECELGYAFNVKLATCEVTPPPLSSKSEYFNLIVPIDIPIGGFAPGRRIKFVGFPSIDANEFSINLRTEEGIAFHFNPRFDERVVALNNERDDEWGHEERIDDFPFVPGQIFTLEFVSAEGEIDVYYDGRLIDRFVERDDPRNIRTVQVNRGVHIHSVHIFN